MPGPRNRKGRIRDQLEGSGGGIKPSSINLTPGERKRARKAHNKRARAFNQKQREKAKEINAQRRADAKKETAERFKSPDIYSNRTFIQTMGTAQDRLNQTNIGLDDQERQLGVSYGLGKYGGSFANNPYSRAALLQRSYDQNQRRTINSMAAAGQLYSGATQGSANFNRFNYGQSSDALQKDYGARTGQIGVQRQSAQDQFGRTREAAMSQAIATTRAENPVTPDNAPRAAKFKPFKPKLMKIRPPINRPKGPGPTGGVRP